MAGNLSHSMRENYETHGVEKYYRQVASTYRNPHFPGIKLCLFSWLNSWWKGESGRIESEQSGAYILDMACGSGEVTVCLLEWWNLAKGRPTETSNSTSETGSSAISLASPLARLQGATPLRAPVNSPVRRPKPSQNPRDSIPRILDTHPNPIILAADPYTGPAYTERTSFPCYPLSFMDISMGKLPPPLGDTPSHEDGANPYDSISNNLNEDEESPSTTSESPRPILEMVICSFALHLIDSSELFALLWELSTKARWLVILEPHKKPEIKDSWGWQRWDIGAWDTADSDGSSKAELLIERVHCRVYKSVNLTEFS